jgi:hypothetical protein
VLDDRDVNHSDRWEFTPVWKEMLVEGYSSSGDQSAALEWRQEEPNERGEE